MISLITGWNGAGASLAQFAGPMALQTTVVAVVLLVLDYLLRRRVRAVVRHALLLLILVKLVLPPSLALPTAPSYWLAGAAAGADPAPSSGAWTASTGEVEKPGPVGTPGPAGTRTGAGTAVPVSWAAWLALAWAAGAAGLGWHWLRRRGEWAAVMARTVPAPEALQRLTDACRRKAGVRRPVAVRVIEEAASPWVSGLWRPVIVVPRRLAQEMDPGRMRTVLLHELGHVRRGDLWTAHLQTFLQVLYWWHPLVWAANAAIRRAREQAVDEWVLVALQEDRERLYPSALLEIAKLVVASGAPPAQPTGILESASGLVERMERLVGGTPPRTAVLGTRALAGLALAGVVLLPMAPRLRAAVPARPVLSVAAEPPPPLPASVAAGEGEPGQIRIQARALEVPETLLSTLISAWSRRPSTAPSSGLTTNRDWRECPPPDGIAVLDAAGLAKFLTGCTNQADVEVLCAPAMTLRGGSRQLCELSVKDVKFVVVGETNNASVKGPVIEELDCGCSFHLTVDARGADESIPLEIVAAVTSFPGYPKVGNKVVPCPYVCRVGASLSTNLPAGQTLLLAPAAFSVTNIIKDKVAVLGDLPLVKGLFRHTTPTVRLRRLLFLVTPTVVDGTGEPLRR